jgi:glutathione S-transferase
MADPVLPMQLFFSPGSPFARKVRVLVRERGLLSEVQETALSPHDDAPELLRTNPPGKVPALLTPELTLFDSPVICEYLDDLGHGLHLVPAHGIERITALRSQALADGLMDAAVAIVLERRRPSAMQSPHWLRRWRRVMERAVHALDDDMPAPAGFDIGAIATACALAYLDYRFPDLEWRDTYPSLATWLDETAMRGSMLSTRPPA